MDADAFVVGGGPAGAAAAILLARAGWRVALAEQHAYPRRKVCGECVSAGAIAVLDALGVGADFRRLAGPPLRATAWSSARGLAIGDLPACAGADEYGRALGRDVLDALLLERARASGVDVLQPVRVRALRVGDDGCEAELVGASAALRGGAAHAHVRSRLVVAAHGSWEPEPGDGAAPRTRPAPRAGDLFAFKANYRHTRLAPGLLPVLAFPGGYGGIVLGDGGRTTLACCIRRDALAACRERAPDVPAGVAVERRLLAHCPAVAAALDGAERIGRWLSVGPIRPGRRLPDPRARVFRVGNAAGESHPLIGEGIATALRSATLLADVLATTTPDALDLDRCTRLQRAYSSRWRDAFDRRLRVSALYAHAAMRPATAGLVAAAVARTPALLGIAARLAGKAEPFDSWQESLR